MAIKLFLRHAVTFFKAVAVVVVPVQIVLIPVLGSALPDPTQSPVAPTPENAFGLSELAPTLGAQAVSGVLNLIATTLATGACFKGLSDAYLGDRPDWRGSLSFAASRLGALVWLSLLTAVLGVLALLAFVVPGVWLFVAWAVAVPALLFEGARGRSALGRSFALVRGRWWPTFGALVLGFMLAAVVQVVVGGLLVALLLTDVGSSPFAGVVIGQVAAAIATVLTTPFTAALVAVIYFDLRVRKEGFDLALLAERIGGDAPRRDDGPWGAPRAEGDQETDDAYGPREQPPRDVRQPLKDAEPEADRPGPWDRPRPE